MKFHVVVDGEDEGVSIHDVEAPNYQRAGKIAYAEAFGEKSTINAAIYVAPLKEVFMLLAEPTNVVQFIPQKKQK